MLSGLVEAKAKYNLVGHFIGIFGPIGSIQSSYLASSKHLSPILLNPLLPTQILARLLRIQYLQVTPAFLIVGIVAIFERSEAEGG